MSDSATLWTGARQAPLFSTVSWSLLKFMSIELVMLPNHFILCHYLFLLSFIFPSIRVFYNQSALHIKWPKYWSHSFSIGSSNVYSGLTSFRTDWFDLLAVQGILKSLLQHHNLKASILCSAFFMLELSHLHTTIGKTTAITIRTFVSKVTSLLFNMLSRFVIAFLPRSKHLLTSWLQSPSIVTLEPKKRKSFPASTFSPFYLPRSDGTPDAMILVLWMLTFKSPFSLSSPSGGSLVPLHFLPLEWYLHIWGCWYFSQ